MTDMLNQGLDWLGQMLTKHCSSQIIYRQDQIEVSINAVFAKTDLQLEDEHGISIRSFVWDFLIASAALGFEPQPGDTIVAEDKTFEVMNLSGDGCWRWTGPDRNMYRIHTKQI
ncbi:hypothetical protein STSP2_01092 [Anaerohalosphaera lusitana]|uniref:Phage head-tail joining protein domain-containing protein n=1 Tax=Anaerohalosphaera lusitana TaxID=1936003 RepID=A0A1U9NK31_9BACT|nr:hypothetical protein [Anaerohalosphaera lusitana]AQT67940.1 hypothetical protein STSP2_01092 [Anaerohalosphaera lusitana]